MADRPARGRKRSPRVARTGGGAPHQVAATAFPVGRSSAVTAFVLAVFTVIFVGLAVHAYTQVSATWDEPIHLTAGYAGLVKHDFRIDPSDPPLLRLWAALPTLVDDASMVRCLPRACRRASGCGMPTALLTVFCMSRTMPIVCSIAGGS